MGRMGTWRSWSRCTVCRTVPSPPSTTTSASCPGSCRAHFAVVRGIGAQRRGIDEQRPDSLARKIGGEQQRGVNSLRVGVIAYDKYVHGALLSEFAMIDELYRSSSKSSPMSDKLQRARHIRPNPPDPTDRNAAPLGRHGRPSASRRRRRAPGPGSPPQQPAGERRGAHLPPAVAIAAWTRRSCRSSDRPGRHRAHSRRRLPCGPRPHHPRRHRRGIHPPSRR